MTKLKKNKRKHLSTTRTVHQKNNSTSDQQELVRAEKYLQQKDFSRASQIVAKILKKDPGHPQALGVQGQIFYRQENLGPAISCQQKALERSPNDPIIHFNLGVFLGKSNRPDDALDAYREALRLDPNYINALNNIGAILHKRRDFEGAISAFEKILTIKPDFGPALLNMGEIYGDKGEFETAIDYYEKGLRLLPESPHNLNNLAILYRTAQMGTMAIETFKKAINLDPDLVQPYNNLGSIYMDMGRFDEALVNIKKSLDLDNTYFHAITNFLLCHNYPDNLSPQEIFAEHKKWGGVIDQGGAAHRRSHYHPIQKNRRIRIGYISPDFRQHAVANFIEPILAAHNRNAFEIICYSNAQHPDQKTLFFKKLADKWRDIYHLDDDETASLVANDQIDILVDLVGHTAKSRLGVFALKPAPIQVTYLGYPNTTGMSTMDYRLTDNFVDPLGQTEHLHTETLVRLPGSFLCYKPTSETLPINNLPMLENGYVTFASFNNRPKISNKAINCWSQILKKLPHSKLLLKSVHLKDLQAQKDLLQKFLNQGIEEDRVDIRSSTPSHHEHLQLYNLADIALDTFPYNGTTTTFEALWMGLPVIAITGQTHVSRVSTSILRQVELQDFAVNSEEEYIAKAISLANDPKQLAILRSTLRQRLVNSPACNASQFVNNLENTYREMAEAWNRQLAQSDDQGTKQPSVTQAPSHATEELRLRGEQLFKTNQFEEAKEAFLRAVASNPDDEIALNNLGVISWQTGDIQEAMAYFQKALAVKPGYINAIDNLSALLKSLHQHPSDSTQQTTDSAKVAHRTPVNHEESASHLVQFGEELFSQNKLTEAAQAFKNALQMNPNDAMAHNNLGVIHWKNANPQEAIKSFSRAIKIKPSFVEAIDNFKAMIETLKQHAQDTPTHEDTSRPRRLHIGGKTKHPAWEIFNAVPAPEVDHFGNAKDLSRFADNTFSEIYASHVVEHFDYKNELLATLREWHRVLKPDGKIYISVPDMDVLARLFLTKKLSTDQRFHIMRMMFGGHVDKHDYHVVGLNFEFLSRYLTDAGFSNIRRVEKFSIFNDTNTLTFGEVPISVNIIAEKKRS